MAVFTFLGRLFTDLLFAEMSTDVPGVIEFDPCSPFVGITEKFGMAVREAGELESVTDHATLVGHRRKVEGIAVVFLVASHARQLPAVFVRQLQRHGR